MSYFDTLTGSHTIDFDNLQGLKAKWKIDDKKRKGRTENDNRRVREAEYKKAGKYKRAGAGGCSLLRSSKELILEPNYRAEINPNYVFEIYPIIKELQKEPDTFQCNWCGIECATKFQSDGYDFCGVRCANTFNKSIKSGLNNDLDCFKI